MMHLQFSRAFSFPQSPTQSLDFPEGWSGAVDLDVAEAAIAAGAAHPVGVPAEPAPVDEPVADKPKRGRKPTVAEAPAE